jgi:hypothetical protein
MHPIPGRYNTDGPWFKGNTHIHTTFSDGGKDYATVAAMYAERGYQFLFITDHGRVAEIEDVPGLSLLALNGIEIDGADETGASFHAVGLGYSGTLPSGGPSGSQSFGVQVSHLQGAGAIVVLAHPYWSGNSIEDALRHGFDGVEVYNHICHYLNGKSTGAYHWDKMLEKNPRTLGFSADDAHLNGDEPWDGAFIMLSARSLNRENIMRSLRNGNFYATRGPRFESIHVDEHLITVRTSPVGAIRLVDNTSWGARAYAGEGRTLTEAQFEVAGPHAYLRVEIEDVCGRLAWTNALLEP